MGRVRFTYEHPPGSGEHGCQRVWDDDYILESNRGKIRAIEVQVGDCLRTTPRYMTKVLVVETVLEE